MHWGFEETKVFLAILSESPFSEKLRTCHQNSQVYRAIAERLRALGFLRTLEQCRYRFKNLLRSYRKAKSSRPPGTCPFYEEMDSLMRARTVIRAMETRGEAVGLPGSGQSGTEADDQEAWGEMEDAGAIRLLTPDSQTPGTGELASLGVGTICSMVQRWELKGPEWAQNTPRPNSQHIGDLFAPEG